MKILRQYERDQCYSDSDEMVSLSDILSLDRSLLSGMMFVLETPKEHVYLQIKKSNLENGLVL